MKSYLTAVAVVALALVLSSPSQAQTETAERAPVRTVAHAHHHGNGACPSCGQEHDAATCDCEGAEEESDGCACEAEEEEAEGPHLLFDNCCWLKRRDITLTGWVAQGITWNPDSPADRFNGPNTFNDRSNEYQLNQVYMYAERVAKTDGCGWAFGGRVDALYGSDWRFTPSGGLESNTDFTRRWNNDSRFYGLALPQLYAEVAYNNLSFKIGRWYTIVGYEVVTAPGQFFYSHAVTHQYGEPFTHTGVLGSYKAGDNWTLYSGFHRGWDMFEDNNDDLGYIGGATWTNDDGTASLAYALTTGDEDNAGTQDRFYNSIVFTRKFSDDLTYVAHHDLGHQNDAVGGQDAEWYAVTQYLYYNLNKCWTAGFRFEWFRDDDGFRVAPPGTVDPTLGMTRGGFAGNFYDTSFGLNYKPNANVTLRPEIRWDWYEGLANGNGQLPYDDGTDDNQFTLGADLIVRF